MAYVQKVGNRWVVKHGTTGEILSRHSTEEAARRRMRALHVEHDPKPRNRGVRARRRLEDG